MRTVDVVGRLAAFGVVAGDGDAVLDAFLDDPGEHARQIALRPGTDSVRLAHRAWAALERRDPARPRLALAALADGRLLAEADTRRAYELCARVLVVTGHAAAERDDRGPARSGDDGRGCAPRPRTSRPTTPCGAATSPKPRPWPAPRWPSRPRSATAPSRCSSTPSPSAETTRGRRRPSAPRPAKPRPEPLGPAERGGGRPATAHDGRAGGRSVSAGRGDECDGRAVARRLRQRASGGGARRVGRRRAWRRGSGHRAGTRRDDLRVRARGGARARVIDAARARLAIAEGDFASALELVGDGVLGALALAHLGRRDEAARVADAALAEAERLGAPAQVAAALHARAVAEPDAERRIALCERGLALEPGGLEAVRLRLELGAALAYVGRRVEARDALRPALADGDAFGATPLSDRARRELVATGLRPRQAAIEGTAALTPRQRQICELAAVGKGNRVIAHELFLSIKTVETHLAAGYRKLGVNTRAELAAGVRTGGLAERPFRCGKPDRYRRERRSVFAVGGAAGAAPPRLAAYLNASKPSAVWEALNWMTWTLATPPRTNGSSAASASIASRSSPRARITPPVRGICRPLTTKCPSR